MTTLFWPFGYSTSLAYRVSRTGELYTSRLFKAITALCPNTIKVRVAILTVQLRIWLGKIAEVSTYVGTGTKTIVGCMLHTASHSWNYKCQNQCNVTRAVPRRNLTTRHWPGRLYMPDRVVFLIMSHMCCVVAFSLNFRASAIAFQAGHVLCSSASYHRMKSPPHEITKHGRTGGISLRHRGARIDRA